MSSSEIQKQKKALDRIDKFTSSKKQKVLNSLEKLQKIMQLATYDLQEYALKENPDAFLKAQELTGARQVCLEWIQAISKTPIKTNDDLSKEIKDQIKDGLSDFHREYVKQLLSIYIPSMHDEKFDFIYDGYLKECFALINERFFELCSEYDETEGE